MDQAIDSYPAQSGFDSFSLVVISRNQRQKADRSERYSWRYPPGANFFGRILSKYIVARREGDSPEAAVQYSLDRAGSAITITTLSLAVGTFILVLSNTFYYQNVALLLTPIIITALLLDLLFLPPLLVRFDNWLERRKPSTT